MKKIFYLKTCGTCKKILNSIPKNDDLILQEIKEEPISEDDLNHMYKLSGSYEKLFSKRARLYKELGLKDKNLQETDFQKYILEHYTFLNRPVMIFDDKIFIGNSQKEIQKAIEFLSND
jgi:arsenate reductase